MIKINNSKEFDDIINRNAGSLVLFGASFCGKCGMAKQKVPMYEEALEKANLKCTIYNIDADECPNVFKEYNIEAMPKFLLFKNGKHLGTRSAIGTTDGIVDFVESLTKGK